MGPLSGERRREIEARLEHQSSFGDADLDMAFEMVADLLASEAYWRKQFRDWGEPEYDEQIQRWVCGPCGAMSPITESDEHKIPHKADCAWKLAQ